MILIMLIFGGNNKEPPPPPFSKAPPMSINVPQNINMIDISLVLSTLLGNTINIINISLV